MRLIKSQKTKCTENSRKFCFSLKWKTGEQIVTIDNTENSTKRRLPEKVQGFDCV